MIKRIRDNRKEWEYPVLESQEEVAVTDRDRNDGESICSDTWFRKFD